MKTIQWIFFLLSLSIYAQTPYNLINLTFEKDLIPEGIAVNAHSGKLFINSLKHDKIVQSNLDGTDAKDFIQSHEHGYLAGFGMTIKGNILYALGNSLPKENNTSILLLLDVTTGNLIKSYPLNHPEFMYLNDIAISKHGKVFITDSETNNIYTINKSSDGLEVFYSNNEIKHSNGIAISDDDEYLYFASYTSGIRVLDIAAQKLVNQPNEHKGIDGMKFYKNSLVAIVNTKRNRSENGVYQFTLSEGSSKVLDSKKLLDLRRESDIPTTFDLVEDTIYFIADSQMDILNQETLEIIDASKLDNYQLIVQKL
ncbi:SMP-30/gluconolactonase/LRE family protein [Flagellimonas sp. CMM7]|uniref:SMP-30/gluconolactonase/LRE family protein n=1 Tax=Flagellimonas sp. CMM7 TaxID=2654676 RepID=UPI0013D25F4E|nr:SMP-30/gluconolactonase/LRE family protein [Flagellimonas sp. CMM7]UII81422.1 SMP-30/gluconolactonase/LRE family protein [Flagellimonas sp. CMM7]